MRIPSARPFPRPIIPALLTFGGGEGVVDGEGVVGGGVGEW
jgi:hypothetical protein